jgi:MFS superfamily sulfate permease-like transporter
MQRLLIMLGVLLVAVGLLWPWLSKLPWGRLPGDISIERPSFSFHFPLVTAIVVSIVVSLIVWWIGRK